MAIIAHRCQSEKAVYVADLQILRFDGQLQHPADFWQVASLRSRNVIRIYIGVLARRCVARFSGALHSWKRAIVVGHVLIFLRSWDVFHCWKRLAILCTLPSCARVGQDQGQHVARGGGVRVPLRSLHPQDL